MAAREVSAQACQTIPIFIPTPPPSNGPTPSACARCLQSWRARKSRFTLSNRQQHPASLTDYLEDEVNKNIRNTDVVARSNAMLHNFYEAAQVHRQPVLRKTKRPALQ